jgi:micrococcal nuclease
MNKRGVRVARSIVALAMVATGCSSDTGRASPAAGPDGNLASISKVTDGDTIRVIFQGHDERVRLIGIDTPEVPWYGGQGECFGVEAGLFARNRLSGRSVRLAFDVEHRDRYGRLLAYVYVDRELFNLTLVQRGYARADPHPPNVRMAELFSRAEGQAQAAGRGLWSACPLGGDG